MGYLEQFWATCADYLRTTLDFLGSRSDALTVVIAFLALLATLAGLWLQRRKKSQTPDPTDSPRAQRDRDAMLTNLLNPKVILLFIALMPNFVDAERGEAPLQLAVLGVALIGVNTLYQVPLSLAAVAARRWLGSPTVQRAVNWGTGTVLMSFAGMMLYRHFF